MQKIDENAKSIESSIYMYNVVYFPILHGMGRKSQSAY